MANERITWLARYNASKNDPGFDPKKFAGKIAGERLAVALKSIRAIGTPFFSSDADLPCSETGVEFVNDALLKAVGDLVDDLTNGKRVAGKSNIVVPV